MDPTKLLVLALCSITLVVAKKPNILIFMVDDLGYGDVGAFGNTTIRTPHIDRLAKEGVKLTHFLTPSPLCTPSRAAFLTGRYPVRLGMVSYNRVRVLPFIAALGGIPTNETTFAEVAKKAGYSTGYVGKWHVGSHCTESGDFCGHPVKRGFDYFYGCLLTLLKDFGDFGESVILSNQPRYYRVTLVSSLAALLVPLLLRFFGLAGRFITWSLIIFILFSSAISLFLPYHGVKFANSVLHRNFEVVEQPIRFENLTQRLVWESVEFLEKQAKRKDTPFLLYVSWFQVHTVLYNSVAEFRGRSQHGPYGDNVEEMDWSVGQVLQALDRLGLGKDTLVVFTSDNGGHVEETDHKGRRAGGHNGPWRGGKAHGGFDGGYRVPTVMRWPGVIPAGSSSDEPTVNMDVFPTLAAVMEQPTEPRTHLDGVSLLPLLRSPSRGAALGERFLFQYCADQVFAVRWRRRDGVWKLHLASPAWIPGSEQCSFVCSCLESDGVVFHQEPRLYNLDEDPEERRPLDTRVAAHREIRERMLAAVEEHRRSVGDVPSQFTPGKTMYRPWLQPCCNFPFCNCRDTKWSGK